MYFLSYFRVLIKVLNVHNFIRKKNLDYFFHLSVVAISRDCLHLYIKRKKKALIDGEGREEKKGKRERDKRRKGGWKGGKCK